MLSNISTELVLQVYEHLNYSDVLNLSLVCKRFYKLLPPSRKLSIYFAAADREFGPLFDAIQVAVLQPQTPYIVQNPPISFPLLRRLIRMGRIAAKFGEVYPSLKWCGNDFVDRRILTTIENYRLRRAVYRIWRYSAAFHTPASPRTTRLLYSSFEKRTTLLRFPTDELLELEDMRRIIQQFISTFIVPSDVRDNFYDKDHVHTCGQKPSALDDLFHTFGISHHDEREYNPCNTGWGGEIASYYLVQDLLKLDPEQILWLKENALSKWEVENFIQNLGDWFQNNGETLSQTLNMVLLGRGHEELLGGLDDEGYGIADKGR